MKKTLNDTLCLLDANRAEWEDRFAKYADAITENKNNRKFEKARKLFRVKSPFGLYISTGGAIQSPSRGKTVRFSLRYEGQDIATVSVNTDNGKVTLKENKNNNKYYGCDIIFDNKTNGWNGEKAKKFRSHFKNYKTGKKNNIEHLMESLILSEMYRKKEKRFFRGIRPVMIADTRYSMTTPLKGSGDGVQYSGHCGGGIDLLTRTRKSDGRTYLNIMELKDENKISENPGKVIRQAIKYAAFIQQLLRSKSGKTWWEIFGFRGVMPDELTILATCVMPYSEDNNDYTIPSYGPLVIDKDKIELHYLYYKYSVDADGKYSVTDTSVTSLQDEILISKNH